MAVLVTGDGFGEQALLSDDSLRTASAQAVEPVETLTLSRAVFEELCRRYPKVQWVLMRQLAAQVRRLSQQVLDALYVPADRRVLRQALALGLVYAGVVPFTQDDLASMAGTTRPTANRAMRAAAEAGCVELRRGGFTGDRSRRDGAPGALKSFCAGGHIRSVAGPHGHGRAGADDAVEAADRAARDREQTMNDTPSEGRTDEPTDIEDTEGHVRAATGRHRPRRGEDAASRRHRGPRPADRPVTTGGRRRRRA